MLDFIIEPHMMDQPLWSFCTHQFRKKMTWPWTRLSTVTHKRSLPIIPFGEGELYNTGY